tara:strand:- start:151 stop:339 length:189 start_codon:yes stop_codon:yes gene_type:complete
MLLTQGELSTLLYCLESMQVDFPEGETSSLEFESLFSKLEGIADQTKNPEALNDNVLSMSLI